MNSPTVRTSIIIGALFLLTGLFRINDLSLYTDSTRYLIWGHSLSEFRGFVDDTQPVPNRFVMNAPLYPLVLVPVEWIFPLSVEAAKIWTLIWGAAAVALFFAWLRRHLTLLQSASLALILALNPLFLTVSTEILTEAPFIALSMLLLIAGEDFLGKREEHKNRLLFLASIGTVMLLREVGAAFVLASAAILFRQKRGKDFLLTGALAGGLFLLWTLRNSILVGSPEEGQTANVEYLFRHFATSDTSSIFSEFLTRGWLNFVGYAVTIGGKLLFPFPGFLVASPSPLFNSLQSSVEFLRVPLAILACIAAIVGIRQDLRTGYSGAFRLITALAYGCIVLLYPVHDIRFLLPLLPLLFFYAALAWRALSDLMNNRRLMKAAGAVLVFLLFAPNAVAAWEILRTNRSYRSDPANFCLSYESEPGQQRYFDQPWSIIGKWIREHCPADAVIASPVKEVAPFVYPRLVLETSRVLPTPVFERFLRDFDVSYVLTVNAWDSVETYQYQMVESRRLWFRNVYGIAGTRIHEIRSAILDPPPQQAVAAIYDTSSTLGLLIEGRRAFLDERYVDALRLFNLCFQKNPSQPEVAFQLVSALCVLGDSTNATAMVQQLFTLPRSTAYRQSVRSVTDIMEQTLKANRTANPSQRSYALFETGLAYWGLGWRKAALSVMRTVGRLDPSNFVGALWGTYLARELGDTVESNRFLDRLSRIDRNAQIVGDWQAIRKLSENIRRAGKESNAAKIHLSLGHIYAKIELFDEAIDETLRALKLEPSNVDAWLYMGEVMEKKKAAWGAAVAYRHVLTLEPHNTFAQAKLDSLSQ